MARLGRVPGSTHLTSDAPLPWAPEFGPGRCFVIAEAGVNHNGDVELARQLIESAAAAGADAVKFQTWRTEKLVTRDAPLAGYQARSGSESSQFAMLKRLELLPETFSVLAKHAKERGIVFASTPDDEESADFLDSLDVPFVKIGSPEVTNLAFLRHVARLRRPVILSTGMSDLTEVRQAVSAILDEGNDQLVLLHCVSSYPAPLSEANVRAMGALRDEFDLPVGFSDHTLGTAASLAAVALGARVLERHLTLDRTLPGPDHAASLDPQQFSALVSQIRDIEASLGDGVKRVTEAELDARETMRRVVVARRKLDVGTYVQADDVELLRAGPGVAIALLPSVLGRRLRADIAEGDAITLEMLE